MHNFIGIGNVLINKLDDGFIDRCFIIMLHGLCRIYIILFCEMLHNFK